VPDVGAQRRAPATDLRRVELIEQGDCIVAPVVLHGRIGESGADLSLELTQVWTLRGGKVIQVREYRTKNEALAALAADR
jgi:ketosteroid isomerase-like protein